MDKGRPSQAAPGPQALSLAVRQLEQQLGSPLLFDTGPEFDLTSIT